MIYFEEQAVGLCIPPPFLTVILSSNFVSEEMTETLGFFLLFNLTFCNTLKINGWRYLLAEVPQKIEGGQAERHMAFKPIKLSTSQ